MSATSTPCEMRVLPDHVAILLYPAIAEAGWSEVEAFGTDVRGELESRSSPACLVDLSQLTYMGSSLVALIVRLWKVVQSRGGKMVIVCANPVVLEVIKLAGLDKMWTILPEHAAARKKLGVRHAAQNPAPVAAAAPAALVASAEPPLENSVMVGVSRRSGSNIASYIIGILTALIALGLAVAVIMMRDNK